MIWWKKPYSFRILLNRLNIFKYMWFQLVIYSVQQHFCWFKAIQQCVICSFINLIAFRLWIVQRFQHDIIRITSCFFVIPLSFVTAVATVLARSTFPQRVITVQALQELNKFCTSHDKSNDIAIVHVQVGWYIPQEIFQQTRNFVVLQDADSA